MATSLSSTFGIHESCSLRTPTTRLLHSKHTRWLGLRSSESWTTYISADIVIDRLNRIIDCIFAERERSDTVAFEIKDILSQHFSQDVRHAGLAMVSFCAIGSHVVGEDEFRTCASSC